MLKLKSPKQPDELRLLIRFPPTDQTDYPLTALRQLALSRDMNRGSREPMYFRDLGMTLADFGAAQLFVVRRVTRLRPEVGKLGFRRPREEEGVVQTEVWRPVVIRCLG